MYTIIFMNKIWEKQREVMVLNFFHLLLKKYGNALWKHYITERRK